MSNILYFVVVPINICCCFGLNLIQYWKRGWTFKVTVTMKRRFEKLKENISICFFWLEFCNGCRKKCYLSKCIEIKRISFKVSRQISFYIQICTYRVNFSWDSMLIKCNANVVTDTLIMINMFIGFELSVHIWIGQKINQEKSDKQNFKEIDLAHVQRLSYVC